MIIVAGFHKIYMLLLQGPWTLCDASSWCWCLLIRTWAGWWCPPTLGCCGWHRGEREGTHSVSNQWNIVLHTPTDTSYLWCSSCPVLLPWWSEPSPLCHHRWSAGRDRLRNVSFPPSLSCDKCFTVMLILNQHVYISRLPICFCCT